jgi:hypothetical protein
MTAKRRPQPQLATANGFTLDDDDALTGDATLDELARLGFRIRRYGSNAAIDDIHDRWRVPGPTLRRAVALNHPEYVRALIALKAPDRSLSQRSNPGEQNEHCPPSPEATDGGHRLQWRSQP